MKIGLLGAARITPKAVIMPAQVMPQMTVHSVAARDRARAEAFAAEHEIARVHDSYETLLTDPQVQLVYNALPINHHARWTVRALEAGKHVLCEKPLAMNMDEARAMQSAAEVSAGRLIEAFHYRYHPAFDRFLAWVQGGSIGTIKSIKAYFNAPIRDTDDEIRQFPETGGGAMMDLGCYPLNWVLMTMSAAPVDVSASATLTRRGVDESMQAQLKFANGVTAEIATSMALDQVVETRLQVVGEKGEIDFINPIAPHMGASLTCQVNGETEIAPIDPVTTYTHQLRALYFALQTGEVLPTEGSMTRLQQQTLDMVYEKAGLAHLRTGPFE